MSQFIGLILLIVVLIFLGVDASCRIFIRKVDPKHRFTINSSIPGYNIYQYFKIMKGLKNDDKNNETEQS